jgi:U-box domain
MRSCTLFCDESELVDGIPSAFLCPLTLNIMAVPMMSRWGHSFERAAILEWLGKGHTCCPITRKPMALSDLIRNRPLEQEIQKWMFLQGEESTEDESEVGDVGDMVAFVHFVPASEESKAKKHSAAAPKRRLWQRLTRVRVD